MSNLHPDLPPFAVVEAALHKTTAFLAREFSAPSEAAPDWNEFEWDVASSVSAMQGISALLAGRLKWVGPPAWQSFLADQAHHTRVRDERFGKLLATLEREMNAAGIPILPLKGSALRDLQVHAPGVRPMSDIDLLVSPRDVGDSIMVLRRIGYVAKFSTHRHLVLAPPDMRIPQCLGEHCDAPYKIELHTAIAEALPFTKVDITDRIRAQTQRAGINRYPSAQALMCHLLLHAAGNMRANALRLMQLIDIAMLARRFGPADWLALLDTSPPAHAWWMYPPLAMTARYLPGEIPPAALNMAYDICPRQLRRKAARHTLETVSWSNLRIAALPGYEWSRNALELMRFARSRILPRRESTNELADAVNHQPDLLRIPWYQQSQANRIVRWLVSRPPRVQTIMTLLAGQTPR
ncbi:MAG TPA: nucleotidyltransferase family protein [Steroidobacteraceae bacterium]|nr:nucleotidyltransferase family protein [Steroidobacteraceae bacterium]